MGAQAWTEERATRCFALRRDGLSFSEIGRELGLTRAAISGYLDRHGADRLKSTPKPLAPHKPRPAKLPGLSGTYSYEVPRYRPNDDMLHLRLLLAALQSERAAA